MVRISTNTVPSLNTTASRGYFSSLTTTYLAEINFRSRSCVDRRLRRPIFRKKSSCLNSTLAAENFINRRGRNSNSKSAKFNALVSTNNYKATIPSSSTAFLFNAQIKQKQLWKPLLSKLSTNTAALVNSSLQNYPFWTASTTGTVAFDNVRISHVTIPLHHNHFYPAHEKYNQTQNRYLSPLHNNLSGWCLTQNWYLVPPSNGIAIVTNHIQTQNELNHSLSLIRSDFAISKTVNHRRRLQEYYSFGQDSFPRVPATAAAQSNTFVLENQCLSYFSPSLSLSKIYENHHHVTSQRRPFSSSSNDGVDNNNKKELSAEHKSKPDVTRKRSLQEVAAMVTSQDYTKETNTDNISNTDKKIICSETVATVPLTNVSSSSLETESTSPSSSSSNPKATGTTNNKLFNIPSFSPPRNPITKEEDWRQRDILHRRQYAQTANAQNERRAANVMRALRGNVFIASAKLAAWASSGSSAMLSEFIHSVVDCANQALILLGLRESVQVPDKRHPYGYGKNIYFWSLISALGTFWMGAGVSMRHSLEQVIHPSFSTDVIVPEVWAVLGISLVVDGYVLTKTISEVKGSMPTQNGTGNKALYAHLKKIKDPALLAILLEDGAACIGVCVAGGGILASHMLNNPVFDGAAGVGISLLLAGMGLILVKLNKEFLLGQSVETETVEDIKTILLQQECIDDVFSVQTQVLGHGTFSVKAEVDFDGTYLAARLLPRYQTEFNRHDGSSEELQVLLSWYAEDVMRVVEREVARIESDIRMIHPGAAYIELEPYGKDSDRFAVDDAVEAKLKRIEVEALNRYLKSLYMDSFAKMNATSNKKNTNNTTAEITSTTKLKDAVTKSSSLKKNGAVFDIKASSSKIDGDDEQQQPKVDKRNDNPNQFYTEDDKK
mmetsp:Transcript_12150/g.14826  ORF Transcript_12150/g.14826 Transcript_12150/m.14826 type:complete len:893 (+) Transcript_12150:133-2811(+)